MKTIELNDDTYAALEAQVRGFGDTPESVIRRLLSLQSQPADQRQSLTRPSEVNPALEKLVNSSLFKHQNGKGRYLALLAFLHKQDSESFSHLDGLRRGKRIQIARDKAQIEASGKSTFPELISESQFWALTNLSNRSKRDVIFSAFGKLGYPDADIRIAVQSIPDSGLERSSLKFFGGDL